MNTRFKYWIKRALKMAGLHVSRTTLVTRFQGMEESVAHLARLGFAPQCMIDGGAHLGEWSQMASGIFPDAKCILVEPQPACQNRLRMLAEGHQGWRFINKALGDATGDAEMTLLVDPSGQPTTGAHVVKKMDYEPGESTAKVEGCTLRDILADQPGSILCKLDLQGHELQALRGAGDLLKKVEVFIIEVSFYEINNCGMTLFHDVHDFLNCRGYQLFDLASLSGRPRDNRLCQGDCIYVRGDSALCADNRWE